jgi:putative restriction endonuclease
VLPGPGSLEERDAAKRLAAFDHVRRLTARNGVLESAIIKAGFVYGGERVPQINPPRGIFKPRSLPFLLSTRTVIPRAGARLWYDDQTQAHRQIYQGDDVLDYAFMGNDPGAPENQWLREARERQVPVIYFLGVSPGWYHALLPTFIVDWSPQSLSAKIAFGEARGTDIPVATPEAPERRYVLRQVKQRSHQAPFREGVLAAYGDRCAISNLPGHRLIDAAHIMADGHEELGQAVIRNGVALSKIHQGAYDANLIGANPDGRVHVSERVLDMHDGPLLDQGLKAFAGRLIRPPRREVDRPDRDRLE